MMTSTEVIASYEEIAELTAQMLVAASKGDWDQLILLEQRCAACVRVLRQNEPEQELEGSNRLKKVQLIEQLLDDHRRIRGLAMPWMATLSALLSSSARL